MIITKIGITGGIAAGKSFACQWLEHRLKVRAPVKVIDMDQVGHQLLEDNIQVANQIVSELGADLLDPSGKISRKRLGEKVFSQPISLQVLNRIIHPPMRTRIIQLLEVMNRDFEARYVIIDGALLHEMKIDEFCNYIVFITASRDIRLRRLIERNHLSMDDALFRLSSQAPDYQRIETNDWVVDNSSSLEDFFLLLEKFYTQLCLTLDSSPV